MARGNKHKLSLITINLNNAQGFEKTIQSVKKQTIQDFEYLVIDGGSQDASLDIIKSNADRIDYCISEIDSGIFNAQNKGWKAARGEYCLFLNSGDCLYDSITIENILKHNLNKDLIYGDILFAKDDIIRTRSYVPYPITFEYMFRSTIMHPGAIISKKILYETNGFDEEFQYCADYDFFLKVLYRLNISYEKIDAIISVFDLSGTSSQNYKSKFEREKVFDKNFHEEIRKAMERYAVNDKRLSAILSNRFLRLLIKLGTRG